jgi:raffinose/stachyose/melibiose transport system permease protein
MEELRIHPAWNVARYTLLVLLSALFLIPVAFIAFTALKSKPELLTSPFYALPKQWQWDNFVKAWNEGNLSMYMKNTIFICLVKVPLGILIEALAA